MQICPDVLPLSELCPPFLMWPQIVEHLGSTGVCVAFDPPLFLLSLCWHYSLWSSAATWRQVSKLFYLCCVCVFFCTKGWQSMPITPYSASFNRHLSIPLTSHQQLLCLLCVSYAITRADLVSRWELVPNVALWPGQSAHTTSGLSYAATSTASLCVVHSSSTSGMT